MTNLISFLLIPIAFVQMYDDNIHPVSFLQLLILSRQALHMRWVKLNMKKVLLYAKKKKEKR